MLIYIDFDGVILNTWDYIYNQYVKKYKNHNVEEIKIKKIMKDIGWKQIIENSYIINNSIEKIKKIQSKYKVCILTKINSQEELSIKKEYLSKNGIYEIVFVPYEDNKSKYVKACGSYLIDDDIQNLDDWDNNNGIAIFFNENSDNKDSYGKINKKYKMINNLDSIYDIIKKKEEADKFEEKHSINRNTKR